MVAGDNKPPQPIQNITTSDPYLAPFVTAIMDGGNKRKLTATSSTLVKQLRPFTTDSENGEDQNQDGIVQGDWHSMDADGLLQKYSIAELNGFQVRIKLDIDRKKQEVRAKVGERYKDVIMVEDIIRSMRDSSAALKTQMIEIESLLETSFQPAASRLARSAKRLTDDRENHASYSVASEIKLLVISSEQIWNALDAAEHLRAGQLFHIARIVWKRLTSNDFAGRKLATKFPIIQAQWKLLLPLLGNISEASNAFLGKFRLPVRQHLDALRAISLIAEDNDVQDRPFKLLDLFLQARKTVIVNLMSENTADMQDSLSNLISCIHETFRHISILFGAYREELKDSRIHNLSSIYSENANIGVIYRLLPKEIQEMDWSAMGLDLRIDDMLLQSRVQAWYGDLSSHFSNMADPERNDLVWLGVDANSLASNRVITRELLQAKGKVWNELQCRIFPSPSISLWSSIFRPIFTRRAMNLIGEMFSVISAQPRSIIAPMVKDLQGHTGDVYLPDTQYGKYIWTCPSESTQNSLLTPKLGQVMRSFESSLDHVKVQVSALLATSEEASATESDFAQDISCLRSFERQSCETCLKEYARGLQDLVTCLTLGGEDEKDAVLAAPFIARIAYFLASKITIINKSFAVEVFEARHKQQQALYRLGSGFGESIAVSPFSVGEGDSGPFQFFLMEMRQVYATATSLWIQVFAFRFRDRFALAKQKWRGLEFWGKDIFEAVTLNFGPTKTAIEGGGEENNSIAADVIRVPEHPSPFISSALFWASKEVFMISGTQFDPLLIREVVVELGTIVINVYESFLHQSWISATDVCESAGLQILFDFRYVMSVLGVDERGLDVEPALSTEALEAKSKVLATGYRNIINLMKSKIDPVELALAEGPIKAGVLKSAARSQSLFGPLLLPRDTASGHAEKAQALQVIPSTSEAYQVIPMHASIPRLSLLPVSQWKPVLSTSKDSSSQLNSKGSKKVDRKRPDTSVSLRWVSKSSSAHNMPSPSIGQRSSPALAAGQLAATKASDLFGHFFGALGGVGGGSSSTTTSKK